MKLQTSYSSQAAATLEENDRTMSNGEFITGLYRQKYMSKSVALAACEASGHCLTY